MLSNLPGIVLPLATVHYVYREKEQKHANGRQQLVDGAIEIWPIAAMQLRRLLMPLLLLLSTDLL